MGSDRNDYYQNDQDSYDFSGSRMGMRSDRDSSFDYEAEDRSYRGAGRQPESYYRDHERGGAEERERDYSAGQHRNRQLDEDVYRSSRSRDEDYNDRKFEGTRNSGHSNYRDYAQENYRDSEENNRGGGGDLYRDINRDRKVMDDDRYETMNWGNDAYGVSRTRDDDYRTGSIYRDDQERDARSDRDGRDNREDRGSDRYQRSRDEYHDREEIRARENYIGRDDFRSQDAEGYRNDHRTHDNLSGLSGGYGRNSTRGSGRSDRGGNRNR